MTVCDAAEGQKTRQTSLFMPLRCDARTHNLLERKLLLHIRVENKNTATAGDVPHDNMMELLDAAGESWRDKNRCGKSVTFPSAEAERLLTRKSKRRTCIDASERLVHERLPLPARLFFSSYFILVLHVLRLTKNTSAQKKN